MSSCFTLGRPSQPSTKDEPANGKETPVPALPASWYHSPSMYQLERRAIFSQRWTLVSHVARFAEPGDFVQITEAGFPFFVIRDKSGDIQAFHNVCRHRAFPVLEEGRKAGRVMGVLACRYHGWSYGLNGNLAKAPKYQDLDGFDKEANGLFKIHTHVDKLGYIWINLNADPSPPSWEEQCGGFDTQPRLGEFDMTKYKFDHQWEMLGDYNWKTLSDNYNECYHCPTGHPALNAVSDFSKYWVETTGSHVQHFNTDRPDKKGMGIFSSFLYPNASVTVAENFMYIMRCIPITSTQTKMEYEVYRGLDSPSSPSFEELDRVFKQVLREDKDLCNAAQKNLEAGVFVNGLLHPRAEKGPLYLQALTRELVVAHRRREEELGEKEDEGKGAREIWPATPRGTVGREDMMNGKGTRREMGDVDEDMEFCRRLEMDCAGELKGSKLEW